MTLDTPFGSADHIAPIDHSVQDVTLTNPQLPQTQIDISIDEPFERQISESWLEAVMAQALTVALPPEQRRGQVGLMITDDETVKTLNAQYRGLDEVTDVLSFSASHPGHWEGEDEAPEGRDTGFTDPLIDQFILPPDELPPLGEVVISYPQTQKQAAAANHPLERELALLIVHGVLHLMGYDHLELEDQTRMQSQERVALEAIFSPGIETI